MKNDTLKERFGHLIPTYYTYINGVKFWNCVCDCGHNRLVNRLSLISGKIQSCTKCVERYGK